MRQLLSRHLNESGEALLLGPVRQPRACGGVPVATSRDLTDLAEERGVGRGVPELVQEQLDGLLALEAAEGSAQLPGELELAGIQEDLLAAGAGGVAVDP